jgi:hypothetical protein
MATPTAVSYQFMPWVRRGLTAALPLADSLGVGPLLPARATVQIGLTLAGANAGTAVTPPTMNLYGPGDVIGVDTRLILRTDPRPNLRNFEPNYLAIVDFDPPDFPWMLTPALANNDGRLRPWLVLIVMERSKTGTPKMPPQGPLPTIRVRAADAKSELPDLGESWAWAHAQVVSTAGDSGGLQADLQTRPESNASRLVCPRRLEPNKDYVACVVPAFEPGRLRGLGLADSRPEAMGTLGPAWDTNVPADVLLPVYHHWEFSTGPGGDFESLARRLKTPSAYAGNTEIKELLKNVGTAPMGVDPLLTGFNAGAQATMEGALVPISYEPGSAPDGTQADSLAIIVNTPEENVVNPVGDGSTNALGRRLEVKPQMVGAWQAKKHQVAKSELAQHWVAGLNLSPRYRGAAGYGAEVVRQNQEIFVDAAWDQIGDILKAEMSFNLTRLAIEAQRALKAKHFDSLPAERLLQVMGPALSRIEALAGNGTAYRIGGHLASLGGQIDRTSLPIALTDTALRRAATPQRRSLRMVARLSKTLPTLAKQNTRYVASMATASTRSAAFTVNDFVPDGILSTTAFDKVNLKGDVNRKLDLSASGMGRQFTVGLVRQIQLAANQSAAALKQNGVPQLKIRAGQHLGVFTDLHTQRFGQLVSATPTIKTTDWSVIAQTVESLGTRGVEGVLIEASQTSAKLQFSTMRLDARSGGLTLDRALFRELDGARREIKQPTSRAAEAKALAGISLGNVRIADARQFSTAGVFASLPVNAVSSNVAATTGSSFLVNSSFELIASHAGAAPAAAVATLTLPPALRRRAILNRYAAATRGTQQLWRDAYAVSRVDVQPVDFSVVSAKSTIALRTHPETTLRARLASTVSVANLAASDDNAFVASHLSHTDARARHRFMIPALFDRVMAWPKLPEALYARLAAYDKNAFMPGVDGIPQDLVMLVRVNQHFVDSFMAGANCEMNRELLWRGFPTDLRGTPFQRFWGRQKVAADGSTITDLDDMQPMHLWGAQPLGHRVDPIGGDPDRVALLVRGQLLRRYPNTAVYAWEKTNGQDTLLKDAQGLPPSGAIQTPTFSGTIGEDITFFGFEIDHDKIDNWCFVLEEQMHEPRFGFDVDVPPPDQPRTGPKQRTALVKALSDMGALAKLKAPVSTATVYTQYNPYKALSWTHIGVQAGGFATVANLQTLSHQPYPNFPPLSAKPNAAEIAKALLQQPFRAYFIGSDLKT